MQKPVDSTRTGTLQYTLPVAPIMLALGLLWLVLILASLGQDFSGFGGAHRRILIDVDSERSLYTWYSQFLLSSCGLLLVFIAQSQPRRARWVTICWYGLAALLILASVDESIGLHERLSHPVRAELGTSGAFQFAWVIPYGIAAGLGLLAAIPFFRSLPRRTLVLFLTAAAIFLAGAVGLEMVGGLLKADNYALAGPLAYRLEANVEEALEGLGTLIFLFALLTYRPQDQAGP